MAVEVRVLKETAPGEKRVATVPDVVEKLRNDKVLQAEFVRHGNA